MGVDVRKRIYEIEETSVHGKVTKGDERLRKGAPTT